MDEEEEAAAPDDEEEAGAARKDNSSRDACERGVSAPSAIPYAEEGGEKR